eukprot:8139131-Alexandrium_andersonii.AAC.1
MTVDPPEVPPPRNRAELQAQATPGTYLPPSPEAPMPSAREVLAGCASSAWFFQGKGFQGADLSWT